MLINLLFIMEQLCTTQGKSSKLICISLARKPNLALSRPKTHSITILADDSLWPKNCSSLSWSLFANSFITFWPQRVCLVSKQTNWDKAFALKNNFSTSGNCTMVQHCVKRWIWKIRASWTLPSHLITMSKKQ